MLPQGDGNQEHPAGLKLITVREDSSVGPSLFWPWKHEAFTMACFTSMALCVVCLSSFSQLWREQPSLVTPASQRFWTRLWVVLGVSSVSCRRSQCITCSLWDAGHGMGNHPSPLLGGEKILYLPQGKEF